MARPILRAVIPGLVALACAALAFAAPGLAPRTAGATPAGGADGPVLVVLVRHAEKAAEPAGDPPLTSGGKARAAALADALKDSGVTAIITSDARRSLETAAPLAEARHLKPTAIPFGKGGVEAQVESVAAEVRRQAGGVVVVVGHSNTIPLIIAALGGPRLPKIPESEYAHLFMLVPGNGGPHLVQTLYGARDGG